jgi:formylaminopyrimidine deformylase / aminopyrimidine aminohydrolase
MLTAIREGTLPQAAFETWLAQDYLFVGYLLRFQARLLARAPRAAQAVLAAGVATLVAELTWFEQQAQAHGVVLAVAPQPATIAYRRILEDLDSADVPQALTMLWTIERTYLDAWSFAAPGKAPYRDFVDHWTAPGFADYVAALTAAADQLEPPGPELQRRFLEVVDAEITFWDTAWQT